jgi:hypothetical protein
MEAGVQTDTLTNKNIVVLREPKKRKMGKPRIKKQLKNIPNATPDIKQQWRMWKGIDERNMLRNVEIDEDIIDKLNDVFGVKQSDIEKALETFQKGRGTAYTFSPYSREQLDNRSVAVRIGGNRMSAIQGGMQRQRGNDWGGLGIEDLLDEYAIAPRFSMADIEASQVARRPLVGSREMSSLGGLTSGINIGGYNMRASLSRAISTFGSLTSNRADTTMSEASRASTMRPSMARPETFTGVSPVAKEGMRTGSRLRTEGYV